MHPRKLSKLIGVAVLAVTSRVTALSSQEQERAPPTLKDCEQTDSAPLVVRACTAVLNGQLDPAERKRILLLRATGWMKEEDFEGAAHDYTSVLEIESANVAALEGRGNANLKGGSFPASIADWTTLIEMSPQADGYYRSRGQAHLGAKQYDLALADFEQSITLAPKAIDAYIGRAQVFSAMGNIEQSKREFERGIAANDRYLPLYWIRGEMAYEWGDKELSIASYVKVLEINSLYEDARRRLQRLGILHPP